LKGEEFLNKMELIDPEFIEKAEEKLYRYEKQGDYLLFLYKFNPGTDEIPGLINLSVVKFIEINSIKYFFWGKDQKNDKNFLIND
jgi:hypothetical protein